MNKTHLKGHFGQVKGGRQPGGRLNDPYHLNSEVVVTLGARRCPHTRAVSVELDIGILEACRMIRVSMSCCRFYSI